MFLLLVYLTNGPMAICEDFVYQVVFPHLPPIQFRRERNSDGGYDRLVQRGFTPIRRPVCFVVGQDIIKLVSFILPTLMGRCEL